MDFAQHYTEEQQHFRQEVAAWLDQRVPERVKRLEELGELDQATWEESKAFQRLLGEKGWLAPTDPVEWGGAGLKLEHALVLREELTQRGLGWLVEEKSSLLREALHQRGTEEQKRRYLPLLARGRATLWHVQMEPGARLDPENLGVKVYRDGDDYILDGEERFVGQGLWPDYLWTLAVAEPEALPQTTVTFLVPAGLEGIRIYTPRELVPEEARRVVFEHVRVPPTSLVGEEEEGWSLMQTLLTRLSGIEYPPDQDQNVTDLLEYARNTLQDGTPLSREPFLQQLLIETYVTSHVVRLFRTRNAWMAATGQPITYELAQTDLYEKQAAMRMAEIVRDVMGLYAFLDHRDPNAPAGGKFERLQRQAVAQQNPSGSPENEVDAIGRALRLSEQQGPPFVVPTPWSIPSGAPRLVDV